jgi:hypothetical protein
VECTSRNNLGRERNLPTVGNPLHPGLTQGRQSKPFLRSGAGTTSAGNIAVLASATHVADLLPTSGLKTDTSPGNILGETASVGPPSNFCLVENQEEEACLPPLTPALHGSVSSNSGSSSLSARHALRLALLADNMEKMEASLNKKFDQLLNAFASHYSVEASPTLLVGDERKDSTVVTPATQAAPESADLILNVKQGQDMAQKQHLSNTEPPSCPASADVLAPCPREFHSTNRVDHRGLLVLRLSPLPANQWRRFSGFQLRAPEAVDPGAHGDEDSVPIRTVLSDCWLMRC